jgi:cellulose biosynthesis protein BcsQ
MPVYALWNNKGGVGKSYLTFQIASEYARQNSAKNVLVIDMCPQANSSSMLLGGMISGEEVLNNIHHNRSIKTISDYVEERISSPYRNPNVGADYITRVYDYNSYIPSNLYLVVGNEQLEILASRVSKAANPGPTDAWRLVHLWISDLINDIRRLWNDDEPTVFIDCNPSFSIYTELALSASDRLLIPFSADGSSKRAVKAVLSLVYGKIIHQGDMQSEFYLNARSHRMSVPQIYMYIGNRLTQMNNSSASAFKTVVDEIGEEIWQAYTSTQNAFYIHPSGSTHPNNKRLFKNMFQYEVNDANTASVVSGALGVPIGVLTAGIRTVAGRNIRVNQSQLDKQIPNIVTLVNNIE